MFRWPVHSRLPPRYAAIVACKVVVQCALFEMAFAPVVRQADPLMHVKPVSQLAVGWCLHDQAFQNRI